MARCGDRPQVEETSYNFYKYRPSEREKYRDPESSNEIESFRRADRNHFCFQLTFRSVYLFWLCRISRAITTGILLLAQLCGAR